jgi:hypothetical protein
MCHRYADEIYGVSCEEVMVKNAISFGIDRRSIGMLWHGVYVFRSSGYVIWHVFASWVGRTNNIKQ